MPSTDPPALQTVAELAGRIDAGADELRRRVAALHGSAGDELTILAGALTRVSDKLSRRCAELVAETRATAPEAGVVPAAPLAAPAPLPPPVVAEEPEAAPRPRSGLAIVATELAVAGASREEIEAYLLERYGISDAGEILDEVLAAEVR